MKKTYQHMQCEILYFIDDVIRTSNQNNFGDIGDFENFVEP